MNTYYDNYSQAEGSMGWPKRKLKLAKKIGADGFKSCRVYPEKLLKWYDNPDNKLKLDSAFALKSSTSNDTRTLEEVKLSIAIKDEKLKELEITKREGEFLSPEEVDDFLLKLRLAFESTVKGWCLELPPKLVGLTQPEIETKINNEVTTLLATFKEQIKIGMK